MRKHFREVVRAAQKHLDPYGGHVVLDNGREPPRLVLTISGKPERYVVISNTPGSETGALHSITRDVRRAIREMVS